LELAMLGEVLASAEVCALPELPAAGDRVTIADPARPAAVFDLGSISKRRA
jgi:hypothetical protein